MEMLLLLALAVQWSLDRGILLCPEQGFIVPQFPSARLTALDERYPSEAPASAPRGQDHECHVRDGAIEAEEEGQGHAWDQGKGCEVWLEITEHGAPWRQWARLPPNLFPEAQASLLALGAHSTRKGPLCVLNRLLCPWKPRAGEAGLAGRWPQQPSSWGLALSVSGSPWQAAIVAAGCWVPLWQGPRWDPRRSPAHSPEPFFRGAALALPTPS